MYLFGGLYCDLDFFCVHNLYNLFYDKDVAFFFEPREHAKLKDLVSNGILFSKNTHHKVFKNILQDVMMNYDQRLKLSNEACQITGPLVLAEMYYKGTIPKMSIYDSYHILPISDTGKLTKEKLQNMKKMSFVYTLWKEGHWDLKNEKKSNVDQSLQYYITYPERYEDVSKKVGEKHYVNIFVILFLLFLFICIIGYYIFK